MQEWSQLGSEIVEVTNSIYLAEKAAFEELRVDVGEGGLDLIRLNLNSSRSIPMSLLSDETHESSTNLTSRWPSPLLRKN